MKMKTERTPNIRIWIGLMLAVSLFLSIGAVLGDEQAKLYPDFVSNSPSPTGTKGFYTFLKNLLRVIDMLPALYLLGMVMIFVHKKHKRIGDIVAGTIVIYERKNKQNRIEKEIEKRGIDKNQIELDEWSKKKIGEKEWKLLKTYMERRTTLPKNEKEEMTKKVSEVLFPMLNVDEALTIEEVENNLMALYLVLKDEWEY